jgi:predicted transposase YbfD/YdcC
LVFIRIRSPIIIGERSRCHGCSQGVQHGKDIENSLHWQLDMSFGEDQSRTRKAHAAADLAALRRVGSSLL